MQAPRALQGDRMRVAEVLARDLAKAGVRHAFGIPGGEVLTLIEALGQADIAYVTARHETAAGLMAEGAWLATGAPGLLVLTVGPGVSNAVNGIANALLDRTPLIVLSGAVDRAQRDHYTHQVFDQLALLAPVVKASFVVQSDNAQAAIEQALALALAHPRGPVHIEVQVSSAHADAAAEHFAATRPARVVPAAHSGEPPRVGHGTLSSSDRAVTGATRNLAAIRDEGRATSESLDEIAAWLASSERPLVLAGLEASDCVTASRLIELLDVWPAPLLTTYKAKGVLDEADPRCIGAVALSPKADALVAPLIAAADSVLLVGYDPVEMRAAYVQPFARTTRVFELACAPRAHGMHGAQLELVGELSGHLFGLTARLRSSRRRQWSDGLPSRVRSELRAAFAAQTQSGLTPLAVSDALSRALPEDVHVTVDTGAHRIVLSQNLRARWPRQLLQSNGLCTMGYALPCAIGLSLASGRRVIAAMGDGGFEMVLGELATLRDLALPVTLLIFDDSSLALIDHKQRAAGYARSGVWLGATDHVAIAHAFGGHGERVHDVPALERALTAALARRRGFSVISCALERAAYAGLL
jgi:acetolactate synthase-1/2/3 large subunit